MAEARQLEARFKRITRTEKLAAMQMGEACGLRLCNAPFMPEQNEPADARRRAPAGDESASGVEAARNSRAHISTGKGEIVFEFFPDDAPRHCAAFINLAKSGFYDGLKFHRVEPGFVVQGGDPAGDGTGGPGYTLKAEFNDRPHVRGTVAMARAGHPDSGGSQFYICLDEARFLDRQYTVFGQMTRGFEALDAIRPGDVMTKVSIEHAHPSIGSG